MSDSASTPPGLFGAVRRLARTVVGTVENRVELLGLELQEEKLRLTELLLWSAAVVFLAVIAVVTLTVAIAFLIGETARPYFLLGAGILYAIGAAVVFILLRNKLRKGPAPFADSVTQLKKDREWLGSLNDK